MLNNYTASNHDASGNLQKTAVHLEDASREHWKDIARAQKKIPAYLSEWDAVTEIAEKHGLGEAETLDMRVAIRKRIDEAQAASRASVGFSKGIATRHTFETLDHLPDLSLADYSGIIALRAPLGSGKTQKIGASFVKAVSGNLGRVAVITHLRSLVSELANRLNAAHYREATETDLLAETTLAITSASLSNPKFSEFFGSCFYLFIDEFSQVRRFFAEKDCGRNPEASMAALRRHIAAAKCVIVTDADLSDEDIRFLETCRSEGEKIRIIDANPSPKAALSLDYVTGEEGIPYILGRAEHDIANGGNVWIACESSERTITFGTYLAGQGHKVLAVTSENKAEPEQAAFLKNPDVVSRQYQAIIASPVISCGISVEHENGPHFTAVYYVGGGRAVVPSDARQSIRRVRYIPHVTACLLNNSEGKPYDAKTGVAAFTAQYGRGPTPYERFKIGVDAEKSHGKAAFMSRFIWQCEASGWTIKRLHLSSDPSRKADVKAIRTAQIDAKREKLKSAPHLSADEAGKLERNQSRSLAENITLEAHKIRMALNVPEITDEAIDLWDGGYGITRLMRFSEAMGTPCGTLSGDLSLVHQRDSAACVKAYAVMWEGIPFDPKHTFRREEIETLYQRCKEHALAWSWLGIVPKSVIPDVMANGTLAFPKKHGPNKFMRDLLDLMGIGAVRGTYQIKGEREETCRVCGPDLEVMTNAIQRLKVCGKHIISYTKLAVSPTLSEPETEAETLFDIPANDDAGMTGTERAIRNEVRALLQRFNGLPASETGTVWLPLTTPSGMQQSMTIPVPDCFMIREEQIYELPETNGAYFSFPFNIDVSESVLKAVREVPAGKRAFIMESSPGVEYVVYVDAMDAPKDRALIRGGYDSLTA